MDKVIVERPRHGSRLRSRKKGYRKYIQSVPVEELPLREPMLGRWKGMQRWLNEHLGPMRRFLRSNIGRPWNNVHQELCEFISFRNAVQAHVLSHIYQYVHRNVVISGRQVIDRPEWGSPRQLKPGEMYICPTSGLLREVRAARTRLEPARLSISRTHCYLRRGNEWWEVRLRERPESPCGLWDLWLEKDVVDMTLEESRAAYGGPFVAVSKRALSGRERRNVLRRAGRRRG